MPRNTVLSIATPRDLWFSRVVCSYGYFLLAPNRWSPDDQVLSRRFDAAEFGLPGEPVTVAVDQPAGRGAPLRLRCDRPVTLPAQGALRGAVRRMLRLDDDLGAWRRTHPTAARRGFGRLFRSATLLEDMVKTITSCNVGWPSTVRMSERLVARIGHGAFPTAEQLARQTPSRLRRDCRVGYRAARIIGLARRFTSGELDAAWFESPARTTEELRAALLSLDGFGPYATANVLQLLGHNDELPIDTETYRLYCNTHGLQRPANDKSLDSAIHGYYEPFRPHRFLAYWYELWRDYERRRGPAWAWDPEQVATTFTASQLR